MLRVTKRGVKAGGGRAERCVGGSWEWACMEGKGGEKAEMLKCI